MLELNVATHYARTCVEAKYVVYYPDHTEITREESMKKVTEKSAVARYAKLNHKIYLTIKKAYEQALVENAVIMNLGDEELLLTIAHDYTAFIHEEKFDLQATNKRLLAIAKN